MTESDRPIRLATPADAAAVRRIYAPFVEETAITFSYDPPTEAELRGKIESTLETHPWLVYERDGRVVGYAYASPVRKRDAYQWAVESSVYVDPDFHRQGIARALYESLFAILDRQGFVQIYAVLTLPNEPSTSLHESLGFEPVGTFPAIGYKHGSWHDVQWLVRRLGTASENPEPPRPISTVRREDGFDELLAVGLDA